DSISLSNLNRLRARIEEIGLPKTEIAARAMWEVDPYLEIRSFSEGVLEENLDAFLSDGGRLDLVVEERDHLASKLRRRERARELRIPVLMDTSDRGMLDVERFDREPHRPVLHGLLGTLRAEQVAGLTAREKVPVALAVMGAERISLRMAASLPEVERSLA